MGNVVKINFEHEAFIQADQQLKQLTENSPGSFLICVHNGEMRVIVKHVLKEVQSSEKVRMTAGSIARELNKRKVTEAIMQKETLTASFPSISEQSLITAFVEGWKLGLYQFNMYKSITTFEKTELTIEGENIDVAIKQGEIRAEATAFARDLTNELSNVLNPKTFPERLATEFNDTNVEVTVFDKKEIEKREMNGLLTVGKGSQYDPAFVELKYCGDPSKPLVALVGKGVTFDTGGISLKKGRNISDMRMDMGGAAAVSGAIKLLEQSEAKVNVVALLPMVENNIGNTAVLPGEIIRYKNGKTVQIGNTDAEGRLILADGIIRAGELEADYIVDIATLTGAIIHALGSNLAGVFGDEALLAKMKEIGAENGDLNWPMPLVDAYDCYIKSDYADFSNISSKGEAGAITAALFLRRFVPNTCKWVHVDMAGVMESKEKGYYANSATGYGTRLLADFTVHVSK